MRRHLIIPDTQVKDGVPMDHLRWISKAIMEYRPDVIVHLGDHADMPSLSSYDKGKKSFEGRRYKKDIDAANEGMDILMSEYHAHNDKRRRWKEKIYAPELHFCLGNHENRINRACEETPELDGVLSVWDLNYMQHGWEVHDFLKPIRIDGIVYAHYFAAQTTGRPLGGQIPSRLAKIGSSFVMGHQQVYLVGQEAYPDGSRRRGLVCGSCYLHDEDYRGYQANGEWRGIFVLNEVRNGLYDLMELSLDYLCRRYEGVHVWEFMREKHPHVFMKSPWMQTQEYLAEAA